MDLNWIFDILTSTIFEIPSWLSMLCLPIIGYFCWNNVYDYNDLPDCVDALGANDATIFVPNIQDIAANLTVDANIALEVIKGGGFTSSVAATLTIEGSLNAGLYQIFFGDLIVVFGADSVKEVYPEWWGIDGTADDVQIEQARVAAVNVKAVCVQGKTYSFTSGITQDTANLAIYCNAGQAVFSTAADITPLTIEVKATLRNIKTSYTGGASTKAGFKFISGAVYGYYENLESNGFKYDLELYDSVGGGVAFNTFVHFYGYDALTHSVYIHQAGGGWASENLFIGTHHYPSATGNCVRMYGSQNKFICPQFENGEEWQFAVEDFGLNLVTGARFENEGYGVYVFNPGAHLAKASRISENYYVCKQPFFTIEDGLLYVSDYSFRGIMWSDDTSRVATTVDANSNSGQKVLNVAATIGFYRKDTILIDEGGAKEEYATVATIQAGVSLTMVEDLRYTHAGGDAATVVCKERKSGVDASITPYMGDLLDVYVKGIKVLQLKDDGTGKMLGALAQTTTPDP